MEPTVSLARTLIGVIQGHTIFGTEKPKLSPLRAGPICWAAPLRRAGFKPPGF
tara:strand:+ start:582 stop:740 length:159 start_codon:yes stop_codon:yes gene_type:complete